MDTAGDIMDLYAVLDRIVPWKSFPQVFNDFQTLRLDDTKESAELVGLIHTNLLYGLDGYRISSELVYEWCGFSKSILKTYNKLFNDFDTKSKSQRAILLKVLEHVQPKMGASHEDLKVTLLAFEYAAGNLTTLYGRLEHDFNKKSGFAHEQIEQSPEEKTLLQTISSTVFGESNDEHVISQKNVRISSAMEFYLNLKQMIQQAHNKIQEINEELHDEIREIADMKVQIEETNLANSISDANRNILTKSADNVIDKCVDFMTRHD